VTKYTTVCVDVYGRVYDLRKEHPSWEQAKKNKGKKDAVFERCIVANAFGWPVDKLEELKRKRGKREKVKWIEN
jgi:hypothetical protein